MGAENSHVQRTSNNLPSIPLSVDLILHKKYGQIRESLSFHRKKKENKLTQWKNDEKSVRMGNCSFKVKYLGCIEVKESRGMDVCQQAIQVLLNKAKHIKGVIHISGDALRVVDETNKGLIVDQTIDKVSFCAPDRKYNNAFAYISRDGTTRRWLCHGFFAIKEPGDRLSHAIGYAFQICLEQKQTRDVIVEYTPKGTSFTRVGSFRRTSITERMIDPQSAIIAEPIPYPLAINSSPHIERARPKGKNSDVLFRSVSMNSSDISRTIKSIIKRQTSLANPIPEEFENLYSNPFSSYGYSILNPRQSISTNPFDDDLIRP